MSRQLRGALAVSIAMLALAGAGLGGEARADTPIFSFSATSTSAQAGSHPDFTFSFEVGTPETERLGGVEPHPCLCAAIQQTTVEAPAGVFGNPFSTPRCSVADFGNNECPVDSQVGVAVIQLGTSAMVHSRGGFVAAVFNMVPRPGEAGLLAFPTPRFGPKPIFIEFTARTESDYGLETKTVGIPRLIAVNGFTIVLWGVPAASEHDALRFPFGGFQPGVGAPQAVIECFPSDPRPFVTQGSLPPGCFYDITPQPSNSPPQPLISNPTTCGVPFSASLAVQSYDHYFDYADTFYPSTTGCSLLSFDPSQSIKPTTTAADSPSGAEFVLTVPQFQNPTVPSPSQLRAAVVTLPEGFTVAPNLINGKTACSDAQARYGSREQAQCPETSKIATISAETPALPGPLHGAAYLGEPKPGDRYRTLLVFDGFGLHVKLPGSTILDKKTGQISIHFSDLPQAPFARFTSHIFGAERGPLATPTRCGTYEVKSVFTPWAGELPEQTSRQFFTIDSGPGGTPCPGPVRPFDPGFDAGTADNTAGVHSPFSLDLIRADGEQNLTGLQVSTPPGFAATLKGIPSCPEPAIALLGDPLYEGRSELASSACPAASQVGTATAAIGAGSQPLYQSGKVYLAGPYKGAPLSFVVVFPAVSGPYDLGNVVVRAAVNVDPTTARVTTVSDPLPQIDEGIPLRTRQVRVDLDRPDFTLNPTNCDAFSVDATLTGDQGTPANPRSRFQVANCADLPYSPALKLRLAGGVGRRGHPAIHATFSAKPGEANTRFVSVTLPEGELLDNEHIRTICTRVQFAANACPAASVLGTAEASTPLLDAPLEGNVYLRSSSHELPDLAIDLEGQIDFELIGRVDTAKGGRLRTIFETVPDAPVSRFALNLAGGSKGLLINSEDLCGAPRRSTVRMAGQNGRSVSRKVSLNPACGSARKKRTR